MSGKPMSTQQAAYTVLARRYRPQSFGDVVGQQHVAQALKNAILADRVAHAYLFTGARGVGKTSMARILAKALNCPQAQNGEPCNQCEMCQAIAAGGDVDVMEIDGASNRGIDDIRALRANVGIRSMRTRIKMYIIDEVHMLTKEAFNALLKTLEEPPPNVKFVFCTTEPQKVPDTILSRCQRFDFSSIETHAISQRLAEIADREGVSVTAEAIDLVARRAGGSMRDSQSLFDQLLAFGGAEISAGDVNQLLGTAGDERLLSIIDAIHRQDRAAILGEVDEAIHAGVQLGNLLDQLVNVYRDLMIVKCGADSVELLGIGPSQKPRLIEVANSLGLQTITTAMQILSETKSRLSRVPHVRALLDLALIRLSMLEDVESLSQLVTELRSRPAGTVLNVGPARSADSPQKKTPEVIPPDRGYVPPAAAETPVTREEPSADVPDEPAPMPEPAGRQITFTEANREEIWRELLTRVDATVANFMRQASRTSIVSPTVLEVVFAPRGQFARDMAQKPDQMRKLEQCLQQITGDVIHLKLIIDESLAGPSTSAQKPGAAAAIVKHEFVKQAEAIFNANVGHTDRIRKS